MGSLACSARAHSAPWPVLLLGCGESRRYTVALRYARGVIAYRSSIAGRHDRKAVERLKPYPKKIYRLHLRLHIFIHMSRGTVRDLGVGARRRSRRTMRRVNPTLMCMCVCVRVFLYCVWPAATRAAQPNLWEELKTCEKMCEDVLVLHTMLCGRFSCTTS